MAILYCEIIVTFAYCDHFLLSQLCHNNQEGL